MLGFPLSWRLSSDKEKVGNAYISAGSSPEPCDRIVESNNNLREYFFQDLNIKIDVVWRENQVQYLIGDWRGAMFPPRVIFRWKSSHQIKQI